MGCVERIIEDGRLLERPCGGTAIAPPAGGPGTELKALLKKIGIQASPSCACNSRAKYMDSQGPDWCEQNIDIVVGWLREEHARQKVLIPFWDAAVALMVRHAIRKSRQKANSK